MNKRWSQLSRPNIARLDGVLLAGTRTISKDQKEKTYDEMVRGVRRRQQAYQIILI